MLCDHHWLKLDIINMKQKKLMETEKLITGMKNVSRDIKKEMEL